MASWSNSRYQSASLVLLVILLLLGNICKPGASSGLSKSIQPRADRPPSDDDETVVRDNWDYFRRIGALTTMYLNKPDADVLRDLQLKKPQLFPPGSQLASRFTDFRAVEQNGWNMIDGTAQMAGEMKTYAPFCEALKDLSLSDTPRPMGKLERKVYDHTLWYEVNGQMIEPVEDEAYFSFITNPEQGLLVPQSVYGTQWLIDELGGAAETGLENPPMSHLSDLAFLDWQRACNTYGADMKGLKHVFIPVIIAQLAKEMVQEIYRQRGQSIKDFADLPMWEDRLCFPPNSNVGQALMSLVQLQGIGWLLLQHRRQLGLKRIRQICIFRDDDVTFRVLGPSFYIELENIR